MAVDNLSFSVKEGEFFWLLGHNGAGKSTTIDCILGLKSFEHGKITILDMDPVKNRKKLMEENRFELTDYPRESYIDGMWNKDSVEEWLTEIQFPVRKI
ncbi:ATP-binding cassette domain-containing protein [Clostridium sporogenes]|uniref:ATP-binding cassette domain-containing protein n=1 Tax=Clostridium sporogenes TaxID=1509 RepID=UPI003F900D2F